MELLHRLRTDEALMSRYGQGDVSAFEVLYGRHKDPLFNFICRSGCPRARAEDVAQETWSAVIGAASGYRPEAKFRTWLFTIARRKLVDDWRRRKPGDESLDEDSLHSHAHQHAGAITVQLDRLLSLLESLPGEQREVFLLKEEGFSMQDIADLTDVGVETVRSRLRYARNTLRDGMGVAEHA